jgi:hypothetical protein
MATGRELQPTLSLIRRAAPAWKMADQTAEELSMLVSGSTSCWCHFSIALFPTCPSWSRLFSPHKSQLVWVRESLFGSALPLFPIVGHVKKVMRTLPHDITWRFCMFFMLLSQLRLNQFFESCYDGVEVGSVDMATLKCIASRTLSMPYFQSHRVTSSKVIIHPGPVRQKRSF